MGERKTRVVLLAEAKQYIKDMEAAARATRDQSSAADDLARATANIEAMGRASMVMGAAAAAGFGLAVSKWADFDAAMSGVQAATGESVVAMDRLSDAALDAGSRTVYSAEESAQAIEELAKAGLSTADILGGGLDGALDLAAAGELEVARAAEISAVALSQFGLSGSEASHVADVLAAGAGKALGSVDDLANGLKFVGPVASSMGVSIEETTGVLALFAQQGIIGEQAGTSLRGVLSSLTSPTSQARAEIERLGISLYDSQGNFLGLQNAAGELASAYQKMDGASRDASLGIIFGRETVTAATALYQAGAEGVDEWTRAVDDSGFAAEVARERLDNLRGDLENLGGALETALIETGEAADGPLRGMVQWVTEAIDAYNKWPPALQGAALGVGLVTAAVGVLGGSALIAMPKLAAFKLSLETLGVTGNDVRAGLRATARFLTGPWAAALLVAGVSVATFTKIVKEGRASQEEITASLKGTADAAEALKLAAQVSDFEAFWTGDPAEALEDLGGLLDRTSGDIDRIKGELQDPVDEAGIRALERLGEGFSDLAELSLPDAQRQFKALTEQYGLTEDQIEDLITRMPEFETALQDQAIELGENADTATLAKIALGELGDTTAETAREQAIAEETTRRQEEALQTMRGAAQDTESDIDSLADAIRDFGSVNLDVREANRQLEDSFKTLSDSIAENGVSLDIHTEEGRANEEAIDAIAQATLDAAAATYEQTGSQEEANAVIQAGRDRLADQLTQFGLTGEAAGQYIDQLGLVPGNVDTLVGLKGVVEAEAQLNALTTDRWVTITARLRSEGYPLAAAALEYAATPGAANGAIIVYADGGIYDENVREMRAHAAGGVETGIYSAGAPILKFAEQETGGEAFISFKPSERERNRQIWVSTGERLGIVDEIREAFQGGQGGGVTIQQTIHPAPGLSEQQVGQIAADKIAWAMKRS